MSTINVQNYEEAVNIVRQLSAEAAKATIVRFEKGNTNPGTVICPDNYDVELLAADPLDIKPSLKIYLKDLRRKVENGGVVVSGLPIPTDDKTRAIIERIISKLQSGVLVSPVNFVLNGVAIAGTQTMFEGWDLAITTHVQAAFDTEAALLADIDNGIITGIAQIDAASWPV